VSIQPLPLIHSLAQNDANRCKQPVHRRVRNTLRQTSRNYLVEPNTPHTAFINNLKLANTRSLLRNLVKVNLKDGHAWGEHILLILVTVKAEAEALMAAHPDLEKDFDAFLNVWKEELAQALIDDQKKE
jgi:hypothetical protein